jgi:hypothetical protein
VVVELEVLVVLEEEVLVLECLALQTLVVAVVEILRVTQVLVVLAMLWW